MVDSVDSVSVDSSKGDRAVTFLLKVALPTPPDSKLFGCAGSRICIEGRFAYPARLKMILLRGCMGLYTTRRNDYN